ncbi:MAG: S9 family peptidase [Bacteroidetes bacterium]|nr:MAG: S9 family peptidase [Bacteroidota bacterium]
MKSKLKSTVVLSCAIISSTCYAQMNIKEPIANKIPKTLEIHNHVRTDNYFWMNNRDSKEVLEHLTKENDYAKAYFSPYKPLIDNLLNEFENRIDPNESSSPFILNGRTYQIRNIEGKDYVQIMRIKDGKTELFLDENERAAKHSFYDLADWSPSPNNELLALSEDFIGRRKYSITIKNLKTGKFLKDKITDTDGTVLWANDNKTFYYTKKDPQTLREFQVYRHTLGTDSKKDELVFQEDDEKYGVHLSKTLTDKYIMIYCFSSTTSEMLLLDADNPKAKPEVFLQREKGHLYEVAHHENGFYILSNKNADNRKVLFSKDKPTDIKSCEEVIKHDKSTLIENVLVLKNYLITEERNNGLRKIKIMNLKTSDVSFIQFEEETYYTGLTFNEEYNTDRIFYSYNSLKQPSSVYALDLPTNKTTLWHAKELKDKNFSPQNYETKRIWATANDGSKIPISLIYKKGIDVKKAPCLLYGYGSYGYTLPDVFSATRISLIDRGFVYAVAHIRGSKYMGEHWYENGKFLKKINTFTDFINSAEYLGMQGYCDPERIYAQGGSAGGLLMGAVTNMAPYLWKGVISQVPFVDVVTTMLDESIPLTVGEYEEWGNPNDPEYYYYMLKYSPYDNIRRMDYPNIYVTTGYHDSQVQYWEPMKYVAKLREYRTNNNTLIFDCNMDAGHGGGSGRSNERMEVAKEFAFILSLEGITK